MELLHTASTVVGFVSTLIVLYVSYRLATFETGFIDKLNGRYLRREESDLIKDGNDKDHERYEKELDQVWARINAREK